VTLLPVLAAFAVAHCSLLLLLLLLHHGEQLAVQQGAMSDW
jgi:hypothetical protein